MKIAGFTLLGLVLLVLACVGIGYTLPVRHQITRSTVIAASPDDVFRTVSNPETYTEWRTGLKSVEMLPRVNDHLSYREKGSDGDIVYVMDEAVASVRVVTRIADDKLPFGGSWTIELAPVAEGTRIFITENGEVYNPMYRFMSKYVFGHNASADNYLRDLRKKYGQG